SSGSICCDSRRSSSPSIPSIFKSVTRMPGKSVFNAFSAADACSCTRVSNPARPSHCVTAWRMEASSSTKRTGPYSGMEGVLGVDRCAVVTRKRDGELRSSFRTVGGTDLTAHVLDDAVGDREPEPKPFSDRLGGVEGIEHAIDLVGRNAVAVVGDGDRDRVARGANRQANGGVVAFGDRVERVAQQVEHHLLELNGV